MAQFCRTHPPCPAAPCRCPAAHRRRPSAVTPWGQAPAAGAWQQGRRCPLAAGGSGGTGRRDILHTPPTPADCLSFRLGTMPGRCQDDARTMPGRCRDDARTMPGRWWDNAGSSPTKHRNFSAKGVQLRKKTYICGLSWAYGRSASESKEIDPPAIKTRYIWLKCMVLRVV